MRILNSQYRVKKSCYCYSIRAIVQTPNPDDDIVIYCSNEACIASIIGYQHLTRTGYKTVRRYAGGIKELGRSKISIRRRFCS